MLGERNAATCGRGAEEREERRASRRGDTLVLWFRRTLPPGPCEGMGLAFNYRAVIGGVPAGAYTLFVIEEGEGRADTVYHAPVTVAGPAMP